ncbi:MAG TPA: PKD domain-containing protein [Tepidisphaeraceae bacterium]|nr:PKD domain-containing protein [Tepidisphaeraceae bacterium]
MERPASTGAVRALFVCPPTQASENAAQSKQNIHTSGQPAGSLEALEGRRLLSSVSLVNGGVLTIIGNDSSSNTLGVWKNGSKLVAVHNGAKQTYAESAVKRIAIHGGKKNDSIWITNDIKRPSVLKGYKGNDTIAGGKGQDWIYGGDDNDKMWGNDNNDFLYGESGDDILWGGDHTDKLDGGPGSDLTDGTGQGPSTGSGTRNVASPKPIISAQRTTIMAGHAIHVHGTKSSLGTGSPQNALYEWDFGDDGTSYNTLQGFNAAHQYTRPGTYTIKLTVTNQDGKSSSTSTTVKVTSNTRKRIYVSKSGSDSNPGTQSRPIKSWGKAASMLGSNVEILFRRGDTFDAEVLLDIKGDNVLIGAYGSGASPVIRWTRDASGYPTIIGPKGDDITIENLTFTATTSNLPQAMRPSGTNITVRGNVFKNLGYAVNGNMRPNGLLVQGNSAPDVGGIESYFVWGQGSDHVYLGNVVRNSREEHAIRVTSADRVLVWKNDLTNTIGEVSGDKTPKGALTLHSGSYYWIARNDLKDGPVAIGPLGDGDGLASKESRFRYGVFDGNTFKTKVAIDHGAERIMFRNNIIHSADSAILVEGYNSKFGRTTNDVTIVNNTAISTSSDSRFVQVQHGAIGVTLTNNLYVAPNLTTGQMQAASVYVADNDLASFKFIGNNVWAAAKTLRYAEGGQNYVWPSWSKAAGYRDPGEWNGFSVVGTDYFSDVSLSGYSPSSSSKAASAGRWFQGVFQDRNGKSRPSSGTWTAGAIQR